MKKLELDEIKRVELGILLELQKVAELHHLTVNLSAGTLLGAIRHKGFIPWDDDIDVAVPRPDYMKLISLYKKGAFPSHIKLISFETGDFNRTFMKLLDTRTVVKNRNDYIVDGNAESLWIDIFPVDGLPDDYRTSAKMFKKAAFYQKMAQLSNARLGKAASQIRVIGKTAVSLYARMVGCRRWNKKIEKLVSQYPFEESKYVGDIAFTYYGIKERMLKKDFYDQADVEFEKHTFKSFAKSDEYLSKMYGDYMTLPPVEKRRSHAMDVWRRE